LDISRFKLIEEANHIGSSIWEEVAQWGHFERDTIGKQIVRAADSISANLSEAYGRYTYLERKRFAYYSRGSLCETLNWLDKSVYRHLIEKDKGMEIKSDILSLSYRLNAYIKSLRHLQSS
jgi:four helix bundle protein